MLKTKDFFPPMQLLIVFSKFIQYQEHLNLLLGQWKGKINHHIDVLLIDGGESLFSFTLYIEKLSIKLLILFEKI